MTSLRVWARGETLQAATAAAWQALGTAIGANPGDQLSDRFDLVEIKVEVHAGTEKKVRGLFEFVALSEGGTPDASRPADGVAAPPLSESAEAT